MTNLIDEPAVAPDVPARLRNVDQQWSELLHPPEHGHVINRDATFGQQLLHIAVREAVA